jgi:hypothetical protein
VTGYERTARCRPGHEYARGVRVSRNVAAQVADTFGACPHMSMVACSDCSVLSVPMSVVVNNIDCSDQQHL